MKNSVRSSSRVPAVGQLALLVFVTALAACGGGSGDGEPSNGTATPPVAGAPSPTPPATVAAPAITTQPSAASVLEGGTVTFSVTAAGSGPLQYQWLLNGTAIAGATSATFTVASASWAQTGGNYSVRVSNSGGSVTSQVAGLTVAATPAVLQPKMQRLSASPSGYMLATQADGRVLAWGTGMLGGTGSPVAGTAARVVAGVSGSLAVSAHPERSLVVGSDGSLFGWGRNYEGALGVQVSGGSDLVQSAVGVLQVASVAQAMTCDRATYALKTDGTVWLVPGQRNSLGVVQATRVPGLSGVNQLVQAEDSGISCDLMALDTSGRAWIVRARQGDWDAATQLRTWTATVSQDLTAPPDTKQLACSAVIFDPNTGHCLALTADGRLWSWGKNNAGQLGLGDNVDRTIATPFATSNSVKTLLAGGNYSYILTTDGAVYGWRGFPHQADDMMAGRVGSPVGNNGGSSNWVPGLLPLISGVDELVMPGRFPQYMAAMKSDGSVFVWGANVNGVFGDGTSGTSSGVPVRVVGVNLK